MHSMKHNGEPEDLGIPEKNNNDHNECTIKLRSI